jgi:hypothetical protein
MPYQYRIVNARIFLEPPQTSDVLDARFSLNTVQPPPSFILASDEAMGLSRHLPLFIRENYGASTGTGSPPVECIDRIPTREQREAFFASHAKSLWEASYSSFDTHRARSITINLLVEYELDPAYELNENDTRFLFFECKQRFKDALAAYRRLHPGEPQRSELDALWDAVARDMLMTYGIPTNRLQTIVKEGSPRWNHLAAMPGQHLSFAHSPKVHWVTVPTSDPIYITHIDRHPLS